MLLEKPDFVLGLVIANFVQNFQGNLGDISFRVAGACLLVLKGLLRGTLSFSSGTSSVPAYPAYEFPDPLLNLCRASSRGENGELRVGVRRAMRQLSNVPSSVISSHSMHLGVLATAWHAINTKSMFTVYYKPRYVC
jgi:hypothetical protein